MACSILIFKYECYSRIFNHVQNLATYQCVNICLRPMSKKEMVGKDLKEWGHLCMTNHRESPFGRFLAIAHLAIPWAPRANVNLPPYPFSMGAKFMSLKKIKINELFFIL